MRRATLSNQEDSVTQQLKVCHSLLQTLASVNFYYVLFPITYKGCLRSLFSSINVSFVEWSSRTNAGYIPFQRICVVNYNHSFKGQCYDFTAFVYESHLPCSVSFWPTLFLTVSLQILMMNE